jgi:hypothetical protein
MNMVLRGEGRLTTQRELWQTPRGEHLTFGQETGICLLAALLRFMEAVLTPLSTGREPNAPGELLPEPGARFERTLYAVACMP